MASKVGPDLIEKHVRSSRLLYNAYTLFTKDREVQELWKMSNVNAVSRLLYNDHGPVHAKIVAGSALELFDMLVKRGVEPTTLADKTVGSIEEAKLVVMLGALLHDIGNSIHRVYHEYTGALLSIDILNRLLPEILGKNHPYLYTIRQEILHTIYATNMDAEALTVEAGVVKIGDGTDMAEGRARYPYKRGKSDIHALSALSIKKVYLEQGDQRPVKISVLMDDRAGFFQIEKILLPKIHGTRIGKYTEINAVIQRNGKEEIVRILP
ncbi:MAG: phosphohydrolase [Desulfurococcales archaeon]|nr:phosphohydrolase [Desulfurococcales archaeon]